MASAERMLSCFSWSSVACNKGVVSCLTLGEGTEQLMGERHVLRGVHAFLPQLVQCHPHCRMPALRTTQTCGACQLCACGSPTRSRTRVGLSRPRVADSLAGQSVLVLADQVGAALVV